MPNTRANFTAFVPQGDSRQETAQMLVQTAREHGIDQRSIRLAKGGFDITDELAEALGEDVEDDEDDETTEPAPDPNEIPKSVPATQTDPQSREGKGDKKTSGNRAEKTKNSKEE